MRGKGWAGGFRPGMDSGQGGYPADPFSPPGPPGPGVPPLSPPPGQPPGPGPAAPGAYPTGPGEQPRQSSPWKYILIGCGALLLLGIIAVGGTCAYMAKKAPGMISKVMDQGMDVVKQQYVAQLTPDHTDKQKQRFQSIFDAVYRDERNRFGLVQWTEKYQKVVNELERVAADGKITVAESQKWCDNAYYALEKNGYWE